MELHKETLKDKVAVLHCSGRLTMVTAGRLKTAVDTTVSGGEPRVVVTWRQSTSSTPPGSAH